MRSNLIIAAVFCVACVAAILAVAETPIKAPMHSYKIQWADEASELPGTSIRAAGLCVEILIGDRVDTVACGVRYVTELPPDTERTTEPDSSPAPTETK